MSIGIILAGGKSSRFKQDKAAFFDPYLKRYWMDLAVSRIIGLTDRFYIVTNPHNQTFLKEKFPAYQKFMVNDLATIAGNGPLSALYTVASMHPNRQFLITAIDYPFLTSASMQALQRRNNVYAIDEKGHAHYTIAHLELDPTLLNNCLDEGNYRLRDFLEKKQAIPLQLPEQELQNYNYPLLE